MASLAEFGPIVNQNFIFFFLYRKCFSWQFHESLQKFQLTAAPILLVSSLVYPGHVSCCLEIRDSFPHVVQQKCPYFPADKRNPGDDPCLCPVFSGKMRLYLGFEPVGLHEFLLNHRLVLWASNYFLEGQLFFKKYFPYSKVIYSH